MTEDWNKEAIFVLADDFLAEVKAKQHSPLTVEDCPPRHEVSKNLLKKLQRVQTMYTKSKKLSSEDLEKWKLARKGAARRNTRRQGVSSLSHGQSQS